MNRSRALRDLSAAMRGAPIRQPDWMQLLEAANLALVTPAVGRALADAGAEIPDDVAGFFSLIEERNAMRNTRLRDMALDAAAALNRVGVEPVLLKGLAIWATCDPFAQTYPRMMSDADLLVSRSDIETSLAALLAAGFKIHQRYPDDGRHVVAELWRDGDVGMLDLHSRLPGPYRFAQAFDPLADTFRIPWPGSVRVPTPAMQVYLTCLHDIHNDGGFWSGGFDIRHLHDIAELARAAQGVDWRALDRLLPAGLLRNAVHSQLVAANRIAGAQIPGSIGQRVVPRLHYRRHRAQFTRPALRLPLTCLGLAMEALNLGGNTSRFTLRARVARLLRPHVHPNRI